MSPPWLNPIYSIHIMGIMHCTLFEHGLKCGMNYTLWKLIYVNGGQGGDLNALWNVWASSLGLGLLRQFGSVAAWLRKLCLCAMWWHEASKVGQDGRYVSHSGLASLFCLFILVFKSYSLSWLSSMFTRCRVWRDGVMGHGLFWGNAMPIMGNPYCTSLKLMPLLHGCCDKV